MCQFWDSFHFIADLKWVALVCLVGIKHLFPASYPYNALHVLKSVLDQSAIAETSTVVFTAWWCTVNTALAQLWESNSSCFLQYQYFFLVKDEKYCRIKLSVFEQKQSRCHLRVDFQLKFKWIMTTILLPYQVFHLFLVSDLQRIKNLDNGLTDSFMGRCGPSLIIPWKM